MELIPEVGNWVTLKTDMPGVDSEEAGKVLEVDMNRRMFYAKFFTEDGGSAHSLEAEEWFLFSKIYQIIKDPRIIRSLEDDYAKC